MAHVQMARLADCPELAMTEADARHFFSAAQNVLRHYSIAATQKAVDLMTFASVAGIIYTPRAIALARRLRQGPGMTQAGPGQYGTGTVFQFTPPAGSPYGGGASPPAAANGSGGGGGAPGAGVINGSGHASPMQGMATPAAAVEPEIIDVETHGPAH